MRAEAPRPGAPLAHWLRWQESLHPQAIALGLERVREVAARLGLPERGLPTITVAGTNGKGSSCRLLTEAYRAAGHRVGTYSSPHLLRYNERVEIDGAPLSDAALVAAFEAVERARGEVPLTYFEYGTLAALQAFAGAGLDLQVLEVGLGGRLDAVNIVDADVALVTSIGLDHVELLGHSREAIGMEKAGIFRAGRPAICADPHPPASIAAAADRLGARLLQLGRDYAAEPVADAWNWTGGGTKYRKLPPPALPGDFQRRNAAGVIAAIESLQQRLPVPETAIRAALARLRLPGRFEQRPLDGERGALVLDVAHNVEAARTLADNLRAPGPGAVTVVLGMLSDKPAAGFAAALAPIARAFYLGGLPPPRGLPAPELASRIGDVGVPVHACSDVVEAFRRAAADRAGGQVLVTGSFLTVAAVAEAFHG